MRWKVLAVRQDEPETKRLSRLCEEIFIYGDRQVELNGDHIRPAISLDDLYDMIERVTRGGDLMNVQVSERALEERVRRSLRKDGYKLVKARSEREALDLGEYYVVDTGGNFVQSTHCTLEDLAKEEGVMKEWEVMA